MAESAAIARRGLAPALEARVGRLIGQLSQALALAGGAALVALAALTVVSVTGRAFVKAGLGPVPGDFELVEIGCAFAVFAFLPWCQYRRGHVTVDVFISRAGPRTKAALSLIGNVLLTGVALLLAWRLQAGLIDKLSYDETTFILQMPVWYGYAAALLGAWLFALTAAYTVWRSLNEMLGRGEGRPGGWA
jgi:TRAP-type C4-dicarboxylate transport system permease small subunit